MSLVGHDLPKSSASVPRPLSAAVQAAEATARSPMSGGRRAGRSLAHYRNTQQALELGQRALRAAVQDGGHPHRLRALAVLAQVVHEDALLRRDSDPLGAKAEDLGLGLVEPDLAGDH